MVLGKEPFFDPYFDWIDEEVDLDASRPYLREKSQELNKQKEKIQSLISNIPFEVMPQDKLVQYLKKKGIKNFIDPHFPPNDTSLFDP